MFVMFFVLSAVIALLGLNLSEAGAGAVMIIALAGIAATAQLLILRKLPKLINYLILSVVSAVCTLLMIRMPAKEPGSYIENFQIEALELEQKVLAGDKGCEKALERFEKKYGKSDTTTGLHVLDALVKMDFNTAWSYLGQYSCKSIDYYSKAEAYYLQKKYDESYTEYDLGYLYSLYIDAAKDHPEWEYMQRMAGISQYEKENYDSARYYLLAAYELDPTVPDTSFYLGILSYQTGGYDECLNYFGNAVENGADDTVMASIAWYLQQIKGE